MMMKKTLESAYGFCLCFVDEADIEHVIGYGSFLAEVADQMLAGSVCQKGKVTIARFFPATSARIVTIHLLKKKYLRKSDELNHQTQSSVLKPIGQTLGLLSTKETAIK